MDIVGAYFRLIWVKGTKTYYRFQIQLHRTYLKKSMGLHQPHLVRYVTEKTLVINVKALNAFCGAEVIA